VDSDCLFANSSSFLPSLQGFASEHTPWLIPRIAYQVGAAPELFALSAQGKGIGPVHDIDEL
jgi:hypothetical protein